MDCSDTAMTGFPAMRLLAIAAICLAAGILLLWQARRRRGLAAVALLLMAAAALAFAGSRDGSASATTPACTSPGVDAGASLTITQTSTMAGLAPGVPPEAIAGVVRNVGSARASVTTVTVSIEAVRTDPAAAHGACDASDYQLTDAVMHVGRTLEPGQWAEFSGASIGFVDKVTNQDACQLAIVDLRYVSA